jgi:hypothetical protein
MAGHPFRIDETVEVGARLERRIELVHVEHGRRGRRIERQGDAHGKGQRFDESVSHAFPSAPWRVSFARWRAW